jgi:hypothetical protein
MSDYGYFDTYTEEDEAEETSSTEEKSHAFLGVERSDEDDPFDERRITYPGFYEQPFKSPPPEGQEKKKVGYYLKRGVAQRLDELATYLGRHTDIDASKSEVVEAAVELGLRDWELAGEESRFLEWIQRR